jgi:hypothetical protein
MTLARTRERHDAWPALPYAEWKETLDTLHMWMQIVGKVKLELAAFLNEWWQVAFHLTSRGMTTGPIPYDAQIFEVNFDFVDHNLTILNDAGQTKQLALVPRTVADFYADFMAMLEALGISVTINTLPTEVANPIRCDVNRVNSAYDPDPVNRWWRIQLQIARVLDVYRSTFAGKSSPINFFWGSFDLSHTRFSGRSAPRPAGPLFYQLSEDQENFACGFWPGNPNMAGLTPGDAAFYAYTYPEPAGFKETVIRPNAAAYDARLGELILFYEDVRQADSPEAVILEFFQSAYEAAATLGNWNRDELEMTPPIRRRPGPAAC